MDGLSGYESVAEGVGERAVNSRSTNSTHMLVHEAVPGATGAATT